MIGDPAVLRENWQEVTAMTATQRQLQQAATQLLRRRGYTWSGRPQKEVEPAQYAFERKLIVAPLCGKSTGR
ncbi:MAG: hypothetical protein AUJ71_01245 [Candidatus Omnitrophica bacterium CG1_02_49_16]|nr:MAG: hypothetical protein AUJ71_01245 [Candidatus Omnitrophica bacterium CG1_02_49_16]